MRNKFAAILALLALAAPAHAAEISITDGWFRALPPSVPSGGYFILRNDSDTALTLTDVESPACGMVMMHKSGKGGMEHLTALDVPPGTQARFEPGGYHLMCMAATPQMRAGGSVPVTFSFRNGRQRTVNFQVRDARGK